MGFVGTMWRSLVGCIVAVTALRRLALARGVQKPKVDVG